MNTRYPLATATWDQKELDAIDRVIKSNVFTMGEEVYQFEQDFASFFNKRYALMVNSGSSANLLMIASLFCRKENPLKAGDEIIVPAVSWSTTYMPLQQYRLKLKFVDVDLQTLNFNLDDLARAISPSTRAILAVNLLGNPNDFKVIRSLIEGRDICLLEDNCESIGAKFQGEYAGCIGLMGTFSTFFSHHISTMEGGVLVTDDEELYHISLSLRAHGWTRNLPKVNRVTGLKSDSAFEESYKFILPGYNLRPLELSGAIGQHQLHKLPAIIRNRRENASTFSGIIRDYEWLISQRETGESSWFGFSLIVRPESGKNRKTLTEALDYHGIEYRPIVAGNFLKNPVISYFDYEVFGSMSNANTIDTHGLFIGNHHYDMCNEFIVLQEALESCCR